MDITLLISLFAKAMHKDILAAATLSLAITSSACGKDTCLQIAQEYADELPNALGCDISLSDDQCGDTVPTADYVASGQQMVLDGLGTCMHSANPARDSKLKQILARFNDSGCVSI